MKKLISVLLVAAMLVSCLALTACQKEREDDGMYTLNYAMSVFPTNWNPHTYQTATDSEILGYTESGFYTFDYNETKDGYKLVPYMATQEPIDVTADYVGEEWGIAEGDVAKAWKIVLRDDLKWNDGTVINAQSFVNSAMRLLNPAANNYRADSLYSGSMAIVNAKNYLYQGSSVKLENAVNAAYAVADLTVGEDGIYKTPAGENVYIAVGYALSDWLGGNSLSAYVNAYGEGYFDLTDWDALAALADEEGLVPMTDEAMGYLITTITGNPAWGEDESCVPYYLVYDETFPEMSFDNVGVKAVSENELVLIMEKPLSGFYLLYSLTGSWLVHEATYDACESIVDGVYTNTYGTAVENTMSYGPYMLTSFQADKEFSFARNPEWFGYNDKENDDLYQCSNIAYQYVPEASTRLEMFLNGELDSYGLQADDMADYSKSDYCYYTTGDSTFFMALNPDLEALTSMQEMAGENINKTILTVKEFRMALSFAVDRAAFCLATSPTNNAAFAVYSSFIVSNPDEGTAYRTTAQAKQVVADFWALTEDIGEGKTYADIDEAIASVTGYNLEKGRQLFDEAYDIAIAEGLMDEDDVVEIKIGLPSATSNFYNNGYEYLVNNYTEAVKGTKLEGKLTFSRDDTIGNAFSDALKTNKVDMLFGVGWTGSALDPYGLMEAYTAPNYQYDPSWDTTTTMLTVNVSGTDYVASVYDWTYAIAGTEITIVEAEYADVSDSDVVAEHSMAFACGSDTEDPELRLDILAALEGAVLATYDMIPLMDDSSASLKGMQYNFYTEDYIYGVGRGGVKYITFNFTDAEWAEYVASQGGTLNYK